MSNFGWLLGVGTIVFLVNLIGNLAEEKKRLDFRLKFYEDMLGKLANCAGEEAVAEWQVEMDKDVEFYKIVYGLEKD